MYSRPPGQLVERWPATSLRSSCRCLGPC